MDGIPIRQIDWGPTIKLGLARSWSAGFVFMILVMVTDRSVGFIELLQLWVFYPILSVLLGVLSWITSLSKLGGLARPLGVLLLGWGDPILFLLSRVLGIFNYADLKLINFEMFLYIKRGKQ